MWMSKPASAMPLARTFDDHPACSDASPPLLESVNVFLNGIPYFLRRIQILKLDLGRRLHLIPPGIGRGIEWQARCAELNEQGTLRRKATAIS